MNSIKRPNYKPFVLMINDISWLSPIKIFFIILFLTVPISIWLKTPTASPIQLAYSISITIYIVKKHEYYLDLLKPVLTLDEDAFIIEKQTLSHFSKRFIFGGIILAPAFFLFVNWRSTQLQELFAGNITSYSFIWSLLMAILSWIAILQSLTVVLSNIIQFKRLGKNFTKINLLDTDTLNPYSMVGLSTTLIIIGSYTIVPIAYLDSVRLLRPALVSLVITLPLVIYFLLAPILALHNKIKIAKSIEFKILTKAIKGDYNELKHSHLNLSKLPKQIDLILYRNFIEKVDEWPIDNRGSLRLALYFLIPILAWVSSSLIDRIIDFAL